MSLLTSPSNSRRTWALDYTRFRGQTPPRACLYLLADVRRGVALSAMLAEQPLGPGLAAWLESATIGRPPPQALRLTDLLPEDRLALHAWCVAHGVVIERQTYAASPFRDPVERLLHSAWQSLGLAPGKAGELPTWTAAQQRLDGWFREHCQR
ncbi:hypothetical protein [Cupriavidus sp. UYPR2.512]|uniref:hypothetical protein n=1 Tax=Cupriavidus sp. UYPR2.512 TaxID=1080187 RepID=UPI00037A20D1|nr:hypothetical protein [Cupriavidus sp. UYPR2.512]UIF90057.1 hypothetical protein KAF44_40550 [Cupriavidus necator]